MEYSIENIKTKKGATYEVLKIKIGEYEKLIFPSKLELFYLKQLKESTAHKEFQEDK